MTDLVNQTVSEVRNMTDAELEREGWDHYRSSTPTVLVFEDGTKVFPSRDPEGNGPGALFGVSDDGRQFRFAPE